MTNVSVLVKVIVEVPSDINRIVYIPMDSGGAWKLQTCKKYEI